jgi:hypothetical protein
MNTKTNPKKSAKKSTLSKPVLTTATAPANPPVVTPPSPAVTPANAVAAIGAGVIAECNSLLGQVSALLGPVVELSKVDIKRSLKLRKGGAQVVTDLIALCSHHGVLSVGPVTVSGMSAEMERANALNQIGVKFAAVQKELTDAAFSAESTCWQYATALYTVLLRLSLMDPTLAEGLAPVRAFFQTKKSKGTKRSAAAQKKVKAGEAAAAKDPQSATATATAAPAATPVGPGAVPAPPAPAVSAAPSGTNGPSATNGAAPVAATTPAANGAAHS